ncbi:hypothetical protein NDU88_003540 [Pleurodeles waltl]|uniref:Uncharacterized protein n=1 Tax=Pleurodeles waltl TaxID=8319 RepID=A0AAV7RE68_PLEWA|nr:hypothetical protein NDU88_003540 [Pleurodeles waltl]
MNIKQDEKADAFEEKGDVDQEFEEETGGGSHIGELHSSQIQDPEIRHVPEGTWHSQTGRMHDIGKVIVSPTFDPGDNGGAEHRGKVTAAQEGPGHTHAAVEPRQRTGVLLCRLDDGLFFCVVLYLSQDVRCGIGTPRYCRHQMALSSQWP